MTVLTISRSKLLIGVTACVATVAVTAMLRGGRATHTSDSSHPLTNKIRPAANAQTSLPVATPAARTSGTSVASVSAEPSVGRQLAEQLEKIALRTDLEWQSGELQKLANQIPIVDIPEALEVLNGSAPSRLTAELGLLLAARWAHGDARAAAQWAEQNLNGGLRQEALNTIGIAWATDAPRAAAEWARSLTSVDERSVVLGNIAYEIGRNDPSAASALSAEMPAGRSRDELIVQLAGAWAASSPVAALDWAGKTPEDVRSRALAAVATAWAENDPVAAGTFAIESLPAGKVQEDAVVGVIQRWVQQQPAPAAAWVAQFPEGNLRDVGLEAVVKLWADKNLVEAGTWLNTLPPGSSRDAAVAAYVEKLAIQLPDKAAEWAKEIRADTLRDQQMENLAELWLRSDAALATVWISQSLLPQSTKDRLLAPLQ